MAAEPLGRCPVCDAGVYRHAGYDFHALGHRSHYFDRISCLVTWLQRNFTLTLQSEPTGPVSTEEGGGNGHR